MSNQQQQQGGVDAGPPVTQSKTEPDEQEGKEYLNTQPTSDEPREHRDNDGDKNDKQKEQPKPKQQEQLSEQDKQAQTAQEGEIQLHNTDNDNKASGTSSSQQRGTTSVSGSKADASKRSGGGGATTTSSSSSSSSSSPAGSGSMIYNVHAPEHSFALPARPHESAVALLSRIAKKSGLSVADQLALQSAKNGAAGVKYEWRGERWDLEDDEDLEVLRKRLPEGETESVTLHIVLPGGGAANNNSQSQQQQQQQQQRQGAAGGQTARDHAVPAAAQSVRSSASRITGGRKTIHGPTGSIIDLDVSTRGESSAGGQESLGDKHKRLWKDFHDNNGVRTVVGKVGDVEGVRMLLKPGYSGVYVSRAFASEHGFIPKTSAMGTYGYAGLVSLGQLPITVGSKTASHKVMLSEESNFDVVLGRAWAEKMGIKTDPADVTSVTYMENGEQIPVDIVVLKDANGEIITVT